ncbi:MAG: glycosyltransferase family 4 protein [Bacteroidales bacterium]|nr:glycosyltransferase family 4 protein [Bacteroidales bacterium]
MKKILIDLSALKYINSGFGQISLNYGHFFGSKRFDDMEVSLLVPDAFVGRFGQNVRYISIKKFYQYLPFLLPKFDIWHAIHQRIKLFPFCKKTKIILTIHDLNFLYEDDDISCEKGLMKLKNLIEKADVVIAISHFTKYQILNNLSGIRKEVRVIYNGVAVPADPPPHYVPSFIKNPKEKFFFTLGEVKKRKNFHVLLDFMKHMPDFRLYIAGSSSNYYARELEKRILLENLNNISLLGQISDIDKSWLYKNCHAFLFPSLLEGFGLPVIEAMHYGKPVFLSRHTSLPEIGSDKAFYWDTFDTEHMVQVVKEKLNYFHSNISVAENLKRYAATFSYEKHFQEYLSLYQSL